MGCRCCICKVACRDADDIEGFLCATHWLRVSAKNRDAYRKAVRHYHRVKSKWGAIRASAWGAMVEAMTVCKDEAKASLGLEDPVPWGSERRSLKPTNRKLYWSSADAAEPPRAKARIAAE